LEVVAEDGQSGVGKRDVLFDGEPLPEAIVELEEPGPHTLRGSVGDRVGNRREIEPYEAIYDPEPPVVTWESIGSDRRFEKGMSSKAWPTDPPKADAGQKGKKRSKRRGRKGKASTADLEWSSRGLTWQTLDNTWQAPRGIGVLLLRMRPGSGNLTLEGPDVQLGEDRRLRVEIQDREGGVGLGQVSFGVRSDAAGGKVLFLEAQDLLGNLHSESWPLVPAR